MTKIQAKPTRMPDALPPEQFPKNVKQIPDKNCVENKEPERSTSPGEVKTALVQRIRIRLQKLGKSERAASLEAGLSDAFLRNIREGKSQSPRIDTLEKIAQVLGTTTSWLISGTGNEEREDLGDAQQTGEEKEKATPNAVVGERLLVPKRRLPVFGQAVGGIYGEFPMNGTVLFDVLCPPQLSEISDAYAVIISGDSMYPRYEDGEIAFIDPTRRVRRGDYVIAQIIGDEFGTPQAYVKKFIRHDAVELVLEQFNPQKELRFPHESVVSVHFVALAGVAQ